MQVVWRSVRNFIIKKILHADDTPHRLAFGVAIGVFVGCSPTMGAQMVICLALATLLRANRLVGLPFVWITNPVTFVPFYYACWWVGARLLPVGGTSGDELLRRLAEASAGGTGFSERFLTLHFWSEMLRIMFSLGAELWVGCTVAGLIFGGIMYIVTRRFVEAYRARRAEHIMRSHERRRLRRAARAARTAAFAGTGRTS